MSRRGGGFVSINSWNKFSYYMLIIVPIAAVGASLRLNSQLASGEVVPWSVQHAEEREAWKQRLSRTRVIERQKERVAMYEAGKKQKEENQNR
eukprot:Clim_evm46s22 gene=Clim_evmTU46s22